MYSEVWSWLELRLRSVILVKSMPNSADLLLNMGLTTNGNYSFQQPFCAEIDSIEARGRSIEAHHDFVSIDAHIMPGRLAAVQKEGGRAWEVERAAVWRWLTCADVREL